MIPIYSYVIPICHTQCGQCFQQWKLQVHTPASRQCVNTNSKCSSQQQRSKEPTMYSSHSNDEHSTQKLQGCHATTLLSILQESVQGPGMATNIGIRWLSHVLKLDSPAFHIFVCFIRRNSSCCLEDFRGCPGLGVNNKIKYFKVTRMPSKGFASRDGAS